MTATALRFSNRNLTVGSAERNGRKTLTTVQGLPKKFDQKKILKVIKKKFGKLFGFTASRAQDLTSNSLQWHHRQRQ
jgi:translation initiation factor 1 (eIF-1/SUI1)